MALSTDSVKALLHSVKNQNNKNMVWKPELGINIIRIIPYKFNPDEFSFTTLKFHYGLKVKDATTGALTERSYVSPDTFNRPDPIVEWANRLQKTGDKNDWKFGKNLLPKSRTYAPILVRGKENEGIKFWGFGKTVFESILNACDPELFGDISDLTTGHDIIVEYKEGSEGKKFPTTTITVKPKPTAAIDEARKHILATQINLLDLPNFAEPTYDTLYNIMNSMMEANSGDPSEPVSDDNGNSPSAVKATKHASVDEQYDALFGKVSA